MRLLALTKYGPMAASTRQRFIQYESALGAAGIEVTYAPLLDDAHVRRVAEGKRASPVAVALAYARRLKDLVFARDFDALWIHCELFPYLPSGFERLAFISRKPIIFDYDDAIFHMYDSSRNAVVRRLLGTKLAPLLRGGAAICAGNDYLRDYAARFNDKVMILPTVVDVDTYRPAPAAEHGDRPVTIGWIGSPSTWAFVRPILPILSQLCREHGARFTAIGAGPAAEADKFDGMTSELWTEASEIAAVQAMDIGIMPLPDEAWARGKCGYKLIQYMACGLPVVGSPIGVNATIVEAGVSGFLATEAKEWREALVKLIEHSDLRAAMGQAGRARAVADFSLAGHAPRLVDLFQAVVVGQRR